MSSQPFVSDDSVSGVHEHVAEVDVHLSSEEIGLSASVLSDISELTRLHNERMTRDIIDRLRAVMTACTISMKARYAADLNDVRSACDAQVLSLTEVAAAMEEREGKLQEVAAHLVAKLEQLQVRCAEQYLQRLYFSRWHAVTVRRQNQARIASTFHGRIVAVTRLGVFKSWETLTKVHAAERVLKSEVNAYREKCECAESQLRVSELELAKEREMRLNLEQRVREAFLCGVRASGLDISVLCGEIPDQSSQKEVRAVVTAPAVVTENIPSNCIAGKEEDYGESPTRADAGSTQCAEGNGDDQSSSGCDVKKQGGEGWICDGVLVHPCYAVASGKGRCSRLPKEEKINSVQHAEFGQKSKYRKEEAIHVPFTVKVTIPKKGERKRNSSIHGSKSPRSTPGIQDGDLPRWKNW